MGVILREASEGSKPGDDLTAEQAAACEIERQVDRILAGMERGEEPPHQQVLGLANALRGRVDSIGEQARAILQEYAEGGTPKVYDVGRLCRDVAGQWTDEELAITLDISEPDVARLIVILAEHGSEYWARRSLGQLGPVIAGEGMWTGLGMLVACRLSPWLGYQRSPEPRCDLDARTLLLNPDSTRGRALRNGYREGVSCDAVASRAASLKAAFEENSS